MRRGICVSRPTRATKYPARRRIASTNPSPIRLFRRLTSARTAPIAMSPRKHGPPYHGQTHNHSHLTSAPGTGGTSTRVALHSQIRLPDELAAEELPARPLEHHAPGLEHVAPGREVERCRHVLLDEEHRQPLGAVETRQRFQNRVDEAGEGGRARLGGPGGARPRHEGAGGREHLPRAPGERSPPLAGPLTE